MNIPNNAYYELGMLHYNRKASALSQITAGVDFFDLSEETRDYLQTVPIIDYTENSDLFAPRFSEDCYYVIGKFKNKFILIKTEGYTWVKYATKLFNFSTVKVGY